MAKIAIESCEEKNSHEREEASWRMLELADSISGMLHFTKKIVKLWEFVSELFAILICSTDSQVFVLGLTSS